MDESHGNGGCFVFFIQEATNIQTCAHIVHIACDLYGQIGAIHLGLMKGSDLQTN